MLKVMIYLFFTSPGINIVPMSTKQAIKAMRKIGPQDIAIDIINQSVKNKQNLLKKGNGVEDFTGYEFYTTEIYDYTIVIYASFGLVSILYLFISQCFFFSIVSFGKRLRFL